MTEQVTTVYNSRFDVFQFFLPQVLKENNMPQEAVLDTLVSDGPARRFGQSALKFQNLRLQRGPYQSDAAIAEATICHLTVSENSDLESALNEGKIGGLPAAMIKFMIAVNMYNEIAGKGNKAINISPYVEGVRDVKSLSQGDPYRAAYNFMEQSILPAYKLELPLPAFLRRPQGR